MNWKQSLRNVITVVVTIVIAVILHLFTALLPDMPLISVVDTAIGSTEANESQVDTMNMKLLEPAADWLSVSNVYTNDTIQVSFGLRQASVVKLGLYDLRGQEVKRIAEGLFTQSGDTFNFQAKDLVNGIYFFVLKIQLGPILVSKTAIVR